MSRVFRPSSWFFFWLLIFSHPYPLSTSDDVPRGSRLAKATQAPAARLPEDALNGRREWDCCLMRSRSRDER